MAKKKKEIELEEMNIILKVPKSAAALNVSAVLLKTDGKTQKVEKRMNTQELYKARQDFLDNVDFGDDYDGKFVITEKGRQFLEEMENKR